LRTAGVINLVLAAPSRAGASGKRVAADRARRASTARRRRACCCHRLLTGLASFVYEICWIRMLSLVLGASTHSFELMLSTFILGLALGGLAVRRLVDRASSPERLLGWVQVAMGLLALATLPVYDRTFELMQYFMKGLARTDAGYLLFNLAGQGVSALVMLPATFCAGMTLPLITGALLRAGAGERAIGQVYAANTLGAIGGVLLAVHVGLPLLGLKGTLVLGALIDTGLGLALLYRFARRSRRRLALAATACLLASCRSRCCSSSIQQDDRRRVPARRSVLFADAKILFSKDGKTATVHLVRYSERPASAPTASPTARSTWTARRARLGRDHHGAHRARAARAQAASEDARGDRHRHRLTMHTLLQDLALERVEPSRSRPRWPRPRAASRRATARPSPTRAAGSSSTTRRPSSRPATGATTSWFRSLPIPG
jgi:hypothetical protein